jgi:hypothetical protein
LFGAATGFSRFQIRGSEGRFLSPRLWLDFVAINFPNELT